MGTPHAQSNVTAYVLGFGFTTYGSDRFGPLVCLLTKQKPDWQKDRLNGIGGKLEVGEDPFEAMAREFAEETGVVMRPADWHCFYVMRFGNGAVVYCFTAHLPHGQFPRTMEKEVVDMYGVYEIVQSNMPRIANLDWLIPMAYHQLMEPPHERMLMPIDRRKSGN